MENEKNSFGNWQAARDWYNRTYDAHLVKYHGWDNHLYRFCARTVGVLLILIALVPLVWFAKSSYRHYAEKHDAEQAQAALARGDYRNAAISAYATLRFNSNNAAACRVMVRLASLDHSPQVLFWQGRLAAAEPTLANKLDLAAEGLVYQAPPFPLTTKILAALPASATNIPAYHAVAADLAMKLDHLPEAEADLATASRLDPTNGAYALSLSVLRLGSTDESTRTHAREFLEELSTNAAFGQAALRTLVKDRVKNADFPNAGRYSRELLAQPYAGIADELQYLEILQHVNTDRFTSQLHEVQQMATNAADAAQLSSWMQANGFLAENIHWLTNLPAELLARQPVRVALAQGYLQSENWTALRDFTAKGNWGDLEYVRLAIVSLAFGKLGDSDVAGNNWDAAVAEASRHYETQAKLYHLVKGWGLENEQEELLKRITSEFPQQRWARQDLTALYFLQGKTAAIHDLSERMEAQFPAEPEWKNNVAATALLLETNLPQAFQMAAEAYAQSPTNQNQITTYAFALHLQGRDPEGLALMARLAPAQIEQPSVALYYGVLLAAVRRNEEAATWLHIAQTKGHLLPEEKRLLTAAQKK